MGKLSLDQCVFTACVWEATARKAGNVHRYRDFKDLTYLDFIQSAHAIAPVIANMVDAPIGETVLECIKATRRVVNTNTNLGIVLLLVPLSKVSFGPPWSTYHEIWKLLSSTTVRDAELVYDSIRLACPGGMGEVPAQDVENAPTQTLLQVMELAAERDTIAMLYAENFEVLLSDYGIVGWLHGSVPIERRICELQTELLSVVPDSLIQRKVGTEAAAEVTRRAAEVHAYANFTTPEARAAYRGFSEYMNAGLPKLNPGTTADIITAYSFVWLRGNELDPKRPFTWEEYDA